MELYKDEFDIYCWNIISNANIDGIVYTGNIGSIGKIIKQLPKTYSNTPMERAQVC